jgi:methionine aminopeptidase
LLIVAVIDGIIVVVFLLVGIVAANVVVMSRCRACRSANEVICHGIPDRRPYENGDIINLDVTVYYKGHHADLNETYFIGEVDADSRRLVETAYNCLAAAVAVGTA